MSFQWTKIFEAEPLVITTPVVQLPPYANDEELKKVFGIELAKDHSSIFEAACVIFPDDANAALWISTYWINDLFVLAAKDLYLKAVEVQETLLDKDQLAARLLQIADSKFSASKEKIDALKLYAEVRGYLNKKDGGGGTFINNGDMRIEIIDPAKEEQKIIDITPVEPINNDDIVADLKLVG